MRYDHPVQILRDVKTAGPTARAAFDISAKVLEEYEKDKGVTFEALDTETLARVKELYAQTTASRVAYDVPELLGALRDLLGLED